MNPTFHKSGLSARRKTLHNQFKAHFRSSAFWIITILVTIFISSCHEKTNGQNPEAQSSTSIAKDSLHRPKVNIQVNRRYDDKGNVIGFDSTYTSYYSNIKGDTVAMDSLMNSFQQYFSHDHSSFFPQEFNTLFFTDSLRYPDFFHDDFFLKRYELNDSYFKGMMDRMDSIKNQFFQQHSDLGKRKNSNDL